MAFSETVQVLVLCVLKHVGLSISALHLYLRFAHSLPDPKKERLLITQIIYYLIIFIFYLSKIFECDLNMKNMKIQRYPSICITLLIIIIISMIHVKGLLVALWLSSVNFGHQWLSSVNLGHHPLICRASEPYLFHRPFLSLSLIFYVLKMSLCAALVNYTHPIHYFDLTSMNIISFYIQHIIIPISSGFCFL